jgi:NitT/TauT family transport system substrate-binding protein
MDATLYQQTVDIATQFGVIAAPPTEGAYVTEYAQAALEGIEEDIMGADYLPAEVEITPGGQ